jgi:signal transduction histidine kinase
MQITRLCYLYAKGSTMGKILPGLLVLLQIIFAFLCQLTAVCAQTKYSIQHYTNENGLPANNIKGVEFDYRTGFLWIGTQAGLVRFDGRNFESFSTKKNLTASRTALIAKNREGTIYIEDDNFSIYRIAGGSPEFVMTDTVYYAFYQSKRWQTLYRAVDQIKQRLKEHKRSSFLPGWAVFHDEAGNSSSFSFVHFEHAYHYDAAEDTLISFPGCNQVFKIERDVYFADSALNIWKYNNNIKKLQPVLVEQMPEITGGKYGKPKLIWKQGMRDPILVYKQDMWKLIKDENILRLLPLCSMCCPVSTDINSVQLREDQGIIFLGSNTSGLYVIRTPFLWSVHKSDTLPEEKKVEYAQVEIAPGIINTASGLSYSAEGNLLSDKPIISFPGSNIYKDQQGNYWYSLHDTIIRYQPQIKQYTKIAISDGSERAIFTEAQNRLYIFSDVAIGMINNGRYMLLYKLPYIESEQKNWLNPDAVVELKPGVFAIATEKLVLFDIKKRNELYTVPIPNLSVKVRALLKYRDYLLIGTYGQGFYIYKNGTVKKMPLDKKGYLSYTHCFMPDDKGFCWISTNRGLFKASMKALIAAYENNLDEIYYHHFDKDDGIYNIELNGGCQPCGLKMSNGLYSFPSMNGVVIFDPKKMHLSPPSRKIFIDEIVADSTSYQLGDNALNHLPYDIKNLRIKLSLPYFGNAENVYFSYKLEPHNEAWEQQDITQNNTLTFGRLKPGSYTLYLRVRNGFEHDQFKTTVIAFRILPPWYQTVWFYIACIIGLIILFWVLLKWRTARIVKRKEELQQLVTQQTESIAFQSKQLETQLTQLQTQQIKLEEDNKIKSRLVSIISHDMISPLKFMSYLSEMALDNITSSDKNYSIIEYMASVANNMESLTENLLNWIRFHHESQEMKPEKFNLFLLVKESIKIASTLAHEKGINIIIDIPEDTEVFHFKQAIGVIIYNLTMNAAKYTSTGSIRIGNHYSINDFAISIADTGPGIPAETVEKLNDMNFFDFNYAASNSKKYQFGYVIIKDLLSLSNGSMKVESSTEKGTLVTVNFKKIHGRM